MPERETPAERRARLRRAAALLGELMPSQTRDDLRAPEDEGTSREAEIRREVPPHHGD